MSFKQAGWTLCTASRVSKWSRYTVVNPILNDYIIKSDLQWLTKHGKNLLHIITIGLSLGLPRFFPEHRPWVRSPRASQSLSLKRRQKPAIGGRKSSPNIVRTSCHKSWVCHIEIHADLWIIKCYEPNIKPSPILAWMVVKMCLFQQFVDFVRLKFLDWSYSPKLSCQADSNSRQTVVTAHIG